MIDFEVLGEEIKKGKINGCYAFCGLDELLIKESIDKIVGKVLSGGFIDLNYIRFDGNKTDFNNLQNACETLPFMSDKKVVLLYRAIFLSDKEDKDSKKRFEDISKYIENLPEHCILIMYYVFEDDREKPSERIKKLDKKCCVVKADKLKGDKLYKKVKDIFDNRGKEIGKIELKYFCDNVDNNMNIISNEVDKLISYCGSREITRQDIIDMFPQKSDNDIFDLVDFVSQKRAEKAIDILNELIHRGENLLGILYMIQRQFKLLLQVRLYADEGKNKDVIAKELRIHPFICEKMITQSRKFSLEQLKKCFMLCVSTEKVLKSSPIEKKTEMELLIIDTVRA